ncbi:MAG: hypothetical protein HY423_05345 [Candidatus Lambdaproteobacteria bacterium]|nr:hypothetical protein [Candidatus Lambdaproteobacteria bacterium]
MRVTDLTKQNSVLRNISTNGERLQTLQEGMSSGRRIHQLSDDPLAATQVQDLRTKISYLNTLQRNIQNNYLWLDRTESELEHVGDLLARAKTLALAQANANADDATRQVTAREMQAIGDAIINSGNAKIGKVFIFSGSKTLTQPLERNPASHSAVVNTDNVAPDIRLILNTAQFPAQFKGHSTSAYRARITQTGELGKARYRVSDDGGSTWSEEKVLLPELELVNEQGKPSEKVRLLLEAPQRDALGRALVYPAGLEFQVDPNPQVAYLGNDDRRMVSTGEGIQLPLNLTGRQIFFAGPDKPGSVDIFDLLATLATALQGNDGRAIERRLGALDQAINQVLENRASVGAVRKELEERLGKLDERSFSNTKHMSELEDLDFPAAVVEMNLADVRNKASLESSSRLIQPSLLNFLR